jgi:hypothetical protein
MQPPFSPAGAITARAQESSLGARKAVYRRVRGLRAWVIWVLAAVVLIVALDVGLGAGQYVLAEALLVAFLAGILVYRYAVPRQLVVLYEHGLVYARGGEVRAARWDDIPFLCRGPGDLTLWLGDGGGQVTIGGFARQQELAAALDAEVQPRALARAEAQLRDTGQATFPPLTVTAAGVQAADKPPGQQVLAWSQVGAYERVGGWLVIELAQPAEPATAIPTPAWFGGVVANVIAAERLMDQADPTTPPAVAAALVAKDVRDVRYRAMDKGRRVRVRAALQGVLVAVVLLGCAAIIHGQSLKLQVACRGDGVAGTAPYHGGPGPHPVDVEGDDGLGSAEVLPPDLVPARRSDVQLVACITSSPTSTVAATCQFFGATGTMYWEDYTITLHAASTGQVVTGPATVQGSNTVCPDATVVSGNQSSVTLYSLLQDSQLLGVISRYAG